MSKKEQRVLTLDPGTKNIGFAFFENKRLSYYGVKSVSKTAISKQKLRECISIVTKLISDFSPNILIVEKTQFPNNKGSEIINKFYDKILSLAKKKNLVIYTFAANTVRERICGNGKATKEDIAKILIAYYPELKPYFYINNKWDKDFHLNMFDAVALGMLQ